MSLKVKNLNLERGARLLQSGLAFELKSGQALWVRGPNGVGKSTLLETLCGFRPFAPESVFWNGQALKSPLDEFHEHMSFIGHSNGNNDNLTTKGALQFYADIYGSQNAAAALKRMGLAERHDVLVRELSAGQQKRLALARLLLKKSALWVLDEPSVSLDKAGVDLLKAMVFDQRAEGGMVIYTSHIDLGFQTHELTLSPLAAKSAAQHDDYLSSDWEALA